LFDFPSHILTPEVSVTTGQLPSQHRLRNGGKLDGTQCSDWEYKLPPRQVQHKATTNTSYCS